MASLVLSGDTSGSITLAAPAVAGSTTQTLVNVTGTLAPVVSGTAITLTNQTAPEFTGIPSWVKRITFMYAGISTNGTSPIQIQLGAGSIATSGYATETWTANTNNTNYTSGFILRTTASVATGIFSGKAEFCLVGSNIWVGSGISARTESADMSVYGGTITLSGTLDRIRLTTVNGTDTFDAGSINILYE
jgi:hypothetical protein